MDSWAVVLADTVLIVVVLVGAALTVVRMRRVGGFAVALAGAACAVLVLAAILDLVWWTQLVPNAIDNGDVDRAGSLTDTGIVVTFLLIALGVGLLIAATNVGRPAVAGPAATTRSGVPTAAQPAAPAHGQASGPAPTIPQQARPAPADQATQPATHAQPAQGFTPPQPAQPDWNIHSGVWSIPRGTFDGPPPDQHRR